MKIQILSEKKKQDGLIQYTKRQIKEVKSFLYDEDCLWLDIGKKRYGINLEEVKKMRKKLLKDLRSGDEDELAELVKKKIKKIKRELILKNLK